MRLMLPILEEKMWVPQHVPPLVVVQIPRNFIENGAFIDIFDLRNPTVVFFIAMLTDYQRVRFVFCGV
jgi:hypothetical protein